MGKQIKKDAQGRNAVVQGSTLFGEDVLKTLGLKDTYRAAPFTVLDSKTGEWQARRKWWMAKGIQSEVGRKEGLAYDINFEKYGLKSGYAKSEDGEKSAFEKGTSVFDATLCELMYTWFCPQGGSILDPFAGGSVRGIIAHFLGFKYTGCELRPEQVASNREQAAKILPADNQPEWIVGDSDVTIPNINKEFDYVFTCPPYMDLEVYSDLPDDLSNMSDSEFEKVYTQIIYKAVQKLKPNRFSTIVIGDVRDKDGFYKDFVTITKNAYYNAGMKLYNDIVLLNSVGTAAMRAGRPMLNRKLAKIHQNVLVFFQGDPGTIQNNFNSEEEISKFNKEQKSIIKDAEETLTEELNSHPRVVKVQQITPRELNNPFPAVKDEELAKIRGFELVPEIPKEIPAPDLNIDDYGF